MHLNQIKGKYLDMFLSSKMISYRRQFMFHIWLTSYQVSNFVKLIF